MAIGKIHLPSEKETQLITCYGQALDNRLPQPVLGDHSADDAVRSGWAWPTLFKQLQSGADRLNQVV